MSEVIILMILGKTFRRTTKQVLRPIFARLFRFTYITLMSHVLINEY